MRYYINGVAASYSELDFKTLIPDANMRRRMSTIVKMGVATAMECIAKSSVGSVDAIITATGLGCLSDSEKFLKSIFDEKEQLLNPTPFIQSTFNTIGGQIAILTGNHNYNMTYSHGAESFSSALLDAVMMLNEGNAQHILVGTADESTPSQRKIMERLRVNYDYERICFFIISNIKTDRCVGEIEIDGINDLKKSEEICFSYL